MLCIFTHWLRGKLTTEISRQNLFHSITYDVRFDNEDERRFDVSHFEFRESSGLQMFPRGPGDLASIAKVVPHGLENVLEEVRPSGGVRHNVLYEEEGSTLQSKDPLHAYHANFKMFPFQPGRHGFPYFPHVTE